MRPPLPALQPVGERPSGTTSRVRLDRGRARRPSGLRRVWVAELRDRVTSDPHKRPILLRTLPTMSTATDARTEGVAWLLDQLGAVTLEE